MCCFIVYDFSACMTYIVLIYMHVDTLTEKKQDESSSDLFVEMPSKHYLEMANVLLNR